MNYMCSRKWALKPKVLDIDEIRLSIYVTKLRGDETPKEESITVILGLYRNSETTCHNGTDIIAKLSPSPSSSFAGQI